VEPLPRSLSIHAPKDDAPATPPAGTPDESHEPEQRLRDAKLAALAEFAAGAGHEINNPLGSIIICAETLLRGETDPERRRLLATIGGQAYRIRDMIGDVMLFARPPKPELEAVDLAATVRHVISRFADQAAESHITFGGDHAAPVLVQADRVQLAIVVSELLRNALNAVDDRGAIRVDARPADEAAGAGGKLVVSDNGHGLSAADREHLFDPFYSGRQAGRGLGFGLSKCWRIVTGHGGRIDVSDNEAAGVTFTVWWPGPRGEDASHRAGDGVL
jgi:signal transduction histidine kinase